VFVAPDGAVLSYEPGGQIEYSAAPAGTISALIARLESTMTTLGVAATRAGIELLSVGIDPYNSIDATPLQLHGARYTAMDRYFAAAGPAGARMMRQTAACQVTVDAGSEPLRRWQLLSAMAPYVTALFANSPYYAGALTDCASARAETWRQLDPARTGLPGAAASDPAAAYETFALRAPAILCGTRDGEYQPFETLLANGGATEADWGTHLTTLFPEVRPRRIGGTATFEVRSADALPVEWCTALCVLVVGLACDRTACEEAGALLGPGGPEALVRAAQCGLRDAAIRRTAAELYELALDGAARLGDRMVGGPARERAEEFGRRYVRAGRSPGSDGLHRVAASRRPMGRPIDETQPAAGR
jgi:glutamate--cysteine ligase